mgnify:CR=1 FL=1
MAPVASVNLPEIPALSNVMADGLAVATANIDPVVALNKPANEIPKEKW